MNSQTKILTAVLCLLFLAEIPAFSAENEFKLVIRDHKFEPAELSVPAGKKIKVIVENLDASAEEFESYPLNREKVIAAHGRGNLFLGPLKPGRYEFFGDFHKDTAKGVLVAKD